MDGGGRGEAEAPYARIAGDIRRRIEAGELRPGDRVPSTRQIIQRYGVAMATATKALAALRQDGLVRPVPGVGTVVNPQREESAQPRVRPAPAPDLDRPRIVGTAIATADAEGMAAVSMRRIAADLGVATMSLYRHVRNKAELLALMIDEVFQRHPLPADAPAGWRERLEVSVRLQWAIYRRHPWLAQAMSFTRPLLTPHAMLHTEWQLAALDGLGLPTSEMVHAAIGLSNHARGTAINFEPEAQARQDTGIDEQQWMDLHEAEVMEIFADYPLPTLTRIAMSDGMNVDLDSLFEFGLQRLLDGIAALAARTSP
ncbi:TetR/AcrR family transcriptional regulator C-terminal domain-containing protein [Bailinhaonella thermotolerans]|uniref:GntR family transcriptional regulator n=1 Tax=Bailinhaonella thermotolerans TaxID=1070861 RepID=A0A3A4A4K5_9ACTN|nr:TetR/AcrR family transcriptional regulator C-terminal domain-containing protein [Bailinhaonella thermotolerans]RJL22594.1 GntR family transcriptional regulator [Bailinhaonella thermotolerans]